MQSGIVYFEEIVENIKDITGLENLRPAYDKIRRWVLNAERDIAAGGLIIRKKKQYEIGDGYYDGYNIIMPDDFIGEHSCADLTPGILQGNVMTLSCKGEDKIDVYYLGFLLDNNGNPTTTRNHLEAVAMYARMRLYSSKIFLGTGNQNAYMMFKTEYEDQVLASRGEDAFPTEEEWAEIGRTMNGGMFEAYTNCGMMCFKDSCEDATYQDAVGIINPDDNDALFSCNIVSIFNSSLVDQYTYTPLPTASPLVSGSATVSGTLLSRTSLVQGQSTITGTLGARVSMSGSANGSSSLT